jgi:hypothetical protein
MGTSRSKSKRGASSAAKTVKPVSSAKSGRGRKKTSGYTAGEDEIRAKANELFNDRIARGEDGSAEDDWLRAERLLRG